jgi:plasmid stabilization system protein ParE
MKVVYTAAARHDVREIGQWLATHYPGVARRVERRIRDVVAHIALWPESAPPAADRAGVRVMPLGHYPYRVFYRVKTDAVEILHVRHTARQPWNEQA